MLPTGSFFRKSARGSDHLWGSIFFKSTSLSGWYFVYIKLGQIKYVRMSEKERFVKEGRTCNQLRQVI